MASSAPIPSSGSHSESRGVADAGRRPTSILTTTSKLIPSRQPVVAIRCACFALAVVGIFATLRIAFFATLRIAL